MVIVEQLSAELLIQLTAERIDSFFNLFRLQRKVFLIIKSNLVHEATSPPVFLIGFLQAKLACTPNGVNTKAKLSCAERRYGVVPPTPYKVIITQFGLKVVVEIFIKILCILLIDG